MLAAVAVAQNADDPLGGLELREVPDPVVPDGWAKVAVRSSASTCTTLDASWRRASPRPGSR